MKTSQLPLRIRLALALAWLPLAGLVLVSGWPAEETVPAALAPANASARNWLAVIALVYAASYVLAWFTRHSWGVSMVRLLLWGLVAFLCISELVDLFGGNQDLVWQTLGASGQGDPPTITALRGQLACWGLGLLMSLTSIFIGFEEPEAPAAR